MLHSFQYNSAIPRAFTLEVNSIVALIIKHSPLAKTTYQSAFSKGNIKVVFLPTCKFYNLAYWHSDIRTLEIKEVENNGLVSISNLLLGICKAANLKGEPKAKDFATYREYSQNVQKFEREMVRNCNLIIQEIKQNTALMQQLAKFKIIANDLGIEMPKPVKAGSSASLEMVNHWLDGQVSLVIARKKQQDEKFITNFQKQMDVDQAKSLTQVPAQDLAIASSQVTIKPKRDAHRETGIQSARAKPVLVMHNQQFIQQQACLAQEAQSRVLALKSKFSR